MSNGPLSNVRVLDIASFMAAPIGAMILADFGADVVKVEHPKGDFARSWGSSRNGVSLMWKLLGRNKRSITIDLHDPAGQNQLRELVEQCDVLVENFRPGTLERWGLGFDTLAKVNPRLVMLSISAFGQSGPNRERAGFGTLAEAISGYAFITGQPDGPPTLPSFGLADSICGLCGAYAVMVALHERDTMSGLGQHIDLALYEPLMLMLGHIFIEYDQLGTIAQRLGSRLPFAAPRNIYRAKDGRWIAMSCSAQSVFERASRAIGRPDLITDHRFVDNAARCAHHEEIDEILADWIGGHDTDEVLTTLNDAGAAAAPVLDVRDIFNDAHFAARENFARVQNPELGEIRMQNVAAHLSRTPGKVRHAGPKLGEHTEEILRDWLGKHIESGTNDGGILTSEATR